jgi:peptidoglycan/LPS O-acetylase OafA/YrhL
VIVHHSGDALFSTKIGWIGVDLFFVLSGSLISGLLFSEYKKHQTIDFKRFLVRRGLKIYPPFYAFLLLTGIVGQVFLHTSASFSQYVHEVFFVMNYKRGVWDHTWSLAVEEHFYLFLPLFLFILARFNRNRENPFGLIPWAAAAVALLCLAFRVAAVMMSAPNFIRVYTGSHTRMDALFFGVLLGYLYHFRPSILDDITRPKSRKIAIALASGVLLSTVYVFERSTRLFSTLGFTFIYLGFGGA